MTRRLIIFLIRRRLGLKKNQWFRFTNQKSPTDAYYFTSTQLLKVEGSQARESNVRLNWILNDECKIEIVES